MSHRFQRAFKLDCSQLLNFFPVKLCEHIGPPLCTVRDTIEMPALPILTAALEKGGGDTRLVNGDTYLGEGPKSVQAMINLPCKNTRLLHLQSIRLCHTSSLRKHMMDTLYWWMTDFHAHNMHHGCYHLRAGVIKKPMMNPPSVGKCFNLLK